MTRELDRFKSRALRGLGKNDVLFVLGDFGFLWDGSREEKKRLDWLAKRPYTILFLDGTHENYEMLDALPVEEKFGGRVQPVAGSVYHVCRGSILELEGMSFLCFGGGESPDKEERDPGVNWWPREMPSDEEYAFCDANVAAHGYKVEYVLTHDAPSRFLDFTILPRRGVGGGEETLVAAVTAAEDEPARRAGPRSPARRFCLGGDGAYCLQNVYSLSARRHLYLRRGSARIKSYFFAAE